MHAVMRYHFGTIKGIVNNKHLRTNSCPYSITSCKFEKVIKIGEKTMIKIFESGENAI